MTLVILSKSPQANIISKEAVWAMLRSLVNIKRGPDAVTASLLRGLGELNYPYLFNPDLSNLKAGDTVLVNGSMDALKWAIKNKINNKFRKLITGPNLVVTPNDYDGIINSSEIDFILQPSTWVKDFYISVSPVLSEKIGVWPAGVVVPPVVVDQIKRRVLIFIKNQLTNKQLNIVKDALGGLPHKFIFYGKFNQKEYFEELSDSQAMLYFSFSESQGLALQEAWARNVPTLVWDRGLWEYQGYSWRANKISCPYLNDRCGLAFSNFNDLPIILKEFLGQINQYTPRDYVASELSDKKSAEILVNIIRTL